MEAACGHERIARSLGLGWEVVEASLLGRAGKTLCAHGQYLPASVPVPAAPGRAYFTMPLLRPLTFLVFKGTQEIRIDAHPQPTPQPPPYPPPAFPEADACLVEAPSEDRCSQMSRHRLVSPGPPCGLPLGLKMQLGNERSAQMPSEGSRIPSPVLDGEQNGK